MTALAPIEFVCPACRSPVEAKDGAYRCAPCNRDFPVLFGIPDFRLGGDQYLSLEDERAKAGKLHAYALDHDFASLVAFYYSITDDVPDRLAQHFTNYVMGAADRAAPAMHFLAPAGGRSLLDLGCGSGGALVAAKDGFERRTGVDIALRWLVIAQKRLQDLGFEALLVCADAEALPFRDQLFSHVMASDLLENTRSPDAAMRESGRVMEQNGRLYVSSSNRRWVGPHPATGVWAAGLVPAGLRSNMLNRRHGVDILRAVSFVSPGSVRRMAKSAGLRQVDRRPLEFDASRLEGRSRIFRFAAGLYSGLAKVPLLRTVLVVAGPVFQSLFVKEEAS